MAAFLWTKRITLNFFSVSFILSICAVSDDLFVTFDISTPNFVRKLFVWCYIEKVKNNKFYGSVFDSVFRKMMNTLVFGYVVSNVFDIIFVTVFGYVVGNVFIMLTIGYHGFILCE